MLENICNKKAIMWLFYIMINILNFKKYLKIRRGVQKMRVQDLIKCINQKTAKKTMSLLFLYIFMLSFCFVLLYPMIYILINSFKSGYQFLDPSVQWVPKEIVFDNYDYIMKALNFEKTFLNTLIYSIGPSLVQLCSCAIAAYGLARFDFRGKSIFKAAMILTILVPIMMIIVPTYVNFSFMDFFGILKGISSLIGKDVRPNLIDTPFVFYLPSMLCVGLKGGLFIYIFNQFFKGLPKELEEASSIDGAGPWRTFLQIVLPSSGSAIITVLIFSVVWHWNDYYQPQMFLSDTSKYTLSVAMNNINPASIVATLEKGQDFVSLNLSGMIFAGSVLLMAPLIIFYLIIQRKFMASIATSGIVG